MQTKNQYLHYLIDPSFQAVNRLFLLSYENIRHPISYKRYFSLTVEIKDYRIMIDRQNLFGHPVKNDLRIYI